MILKRYCCLLLALLLLAGIPAFAHAEADVFVPPTLSDDAPKYDPEHPELLSDDQLYARSAIAKKQSFRPAFCQVPNNQKMPCRFSYFFLY